jgi:hypothetical protein
MEREIRERESSHHNAACQLIHAAIRKSAKNGGALHNAPDLVLITGDAGS